MNINQLVSTNDFYNVDDYQEPCAVASDAEALMTGSMDSRRVEQRITQLAAACTMCETVQCDFVTVANTEL